VPEDPAVARAAQAAALGQHDRLSPAQADGLVITAASDDDARVRAAALAALVRSTTTHHATSAWTRAISDHDARVRRRAADLAPQLQNADVTIPALTELLDDREVTVVTSAAWALGEQRTVPDATIDALAHTTTTHKDPRAREAAVAALGALGHQGGLPAILKACDDKPAVRRRAVLALSAYEGPQVDVALQRATTDKDWQVRQAAEDLLVSPEQQE
jgi:HEAT repeat protein